MRLIDADALCAELQKEFGSPEGHGKLMRVNYIISNAPTVDAVQIVRCRDCKYCFSIDSDPMEPYAGENYWYCERWDQETSAYGTDPERFYCGDAERRED
jgi:hypothetical protein